MGAAIVKQEQTQRKQKSGIENLGRFVSVFAEKDEDQKHHQKMLDADIPAETVDIHAGPEQNTHVQDAVRNKSTPSVG